MINHHDDADEEITPRQFAQMLEAELRRLFPDFFDPIITDPAQ